MTTAQISADPVTRIVIIGGGTAGWMAASVLSKALVGRVSIQLIESDAIGTVGVGEATIPQIRLINHYLGLDENAFLKHCKGTFKLGVQFNNWGRIGDSYMHAFGDLGLPLGPLSFPHYWLRAQQEGVGGDLWNYSLNYQTAMQGRFSRLEKVGTSHLGGIKYAFHFDAGLYARYLRAGCEKRGVNRTEGRIVKTNLRGTDGFIESVILESGATIAGDLFVDCSGFRGLLIEQALKTGYEDWSHWLPCNRAVTVASEPTGPVRPYTQATAQQSGWQWRIPLQHRVGNGHVYSAAHISDDEATHQLLQNLESPALSDPKALRFKTGRRQQAWNRNCVALGLAAGFMEPLESTSIHLIQSGISRLVSLFPDRHFDPSLIDLYNRQTQFEYERVRDFLILHFKATQRRDTAFWQACAHMDIPHSLQEKIDLFSATGRIVREGEELFTEMGWIQVFTGQHIKARCHHPLADNITQSQLTEFLDNIEKLITHTVPSLPHHADFITHNCRAAA
ncbi:tryptophan halogenase [Iodidimonas gelatinilytica]|uniref:Tryptophan halogenase n=1 Tax=Iodidimonas gelatinilytica TaxID=1236966 RepID=A0A5A7MLP5_9PROT|nr:tryptophan halogenase family protein [Iodidimonas gelatinilytica]GEQ96614.1 tryptophan halogenase [Iodidimonas gelatinilytica]GER00067.1 tryptophan halogenase [Iodidimonas gelatinilytica]